MPLKLAPACQSNIPTMGRTAPLHIHGKGSWTIRSITLIVDDPDEPGQTFVHWVIYNIPANSSGLPLGVHKDKSLDDGSLQGKNDFGRIGYNGPCPPLGKSHRYFFKVYALDTTLSLKSGAVKSHLEAAISGHILAQGEMIGKYGRWPNM